VGKPAFGPQDLPEGQSEVCAHKIVAPWFSQLDFEVQVYNVGVPLQQLECCGHSSGLPQSKRAPAQAAVVEIQDAWKSVSRRTRCRDARVGANREVGLDFVGQRTRFPRRQQHRGPTNCPSSQTQESSNGESQGERGARALSPGRASPVCRCSHGGVRRTARSPRAVGESYRVFAWPQGCTGPQGR
jgi:hypothetical protein